MFSILAFIGINWSHDLLFVNVVVQIFPWFKFFQTSLILFSFVSDYDNEYKTKRNKNQTGLKKFKPR